MFTTVIEGASLIVTMARPPANAINEQWIDDLTRILDEHEEREDLRVVRFRSGLPLFCAGADIDMLAERLASEDGVARMVDTVRRLQGVFARIERSPLVSVAEINGVALGAGVNGPCPATFGSPPKRRRSVCRKGASGCCLRPAAPSASPSCAVRRSRAV